MFLTFCLSKVDADEAKARFPFLQLPADFVAFHQPDASGHLNPRQLVKAQKLLARKFGGKVVDGSVVDVVSDETGDDGERGEHICIDCSRGSCCNCC